MIIKSCHPDPTLMKNLLLQLLGMLSAHSPQLLVPPGCLSCRQLPLHKSKPFPADPQSKWQINSGSRDLVLSMLLVKVCQLCQTLCDLMDYTNPWNSLGQITGVGSCSLLSETFPTQGSNPGLPHCRQIIYQLRHQGNPRILEWVDYPFSSRSSQPRS